MPVIDLGSVVGPQGPQGATGATGAQGIQGNPGPNQVTDQTSTNFNGVLFGNQSRVTVKPVDASPTADSTNLVSSGGVKTALDGKANPGQIGYPESGTTASRNYSDRDYICWNGLLYIANQSISSGTTLSAETGGNLTEVESGGLNAINSRQALINENVIFEVSGRTAIFRSNDNMASSTDIRNTIIPQYFRPKANVSIPIAYYNGSSWVNEGRFLRVYSGAGNVIISNLLGGIDSTLNFTYSVFCATWTF